MLDHHHPGSFLSFIILVLYSTAHFHLHHLHPHKSHDPQSQTNYAGLARRGGDRIRNLFRQIFSGERGRQTTPHPLSKKSQEIIQNGAIQIYHIFFFPRQNGFNIRPIFQDFTRNFIESPSKKKEIKSLNSSKKQKITIFFARLRRNPKIFLFFAFNIIHILIYYTYFNILYIF